MLDDVISIQIGATSALTYSNLKPSNILSPKADEQKTGKAIFIDEKINFDIFDYGSPIDIQDDIAQSHIMSPITKKSFSNEIYKNISINKDHHFIPIPSGHDQKNPHVFEHLEYLYGNRFIDEFEESTRKMSERSDTLSGFQIMTESFSSLAPTCPIILDHLEDIFPKTYKLIYSFWNRSNDSFRAYGHSMFLNTYLTIDALDHSDTLVFPMSHLNSFCPKMQSKSLPFCLWPNHNINMDLYNLYDRCQLFGYLINSFANSDKSSGLSLSMTVSEFLAASGTSSGSIGGVSMYSLEPANSSSYYLSFLGSKLDTNPYLCLTPDIKEPHPQMGCFNCQLLSLNAYPELLNPSSGNKEVLQFLSKYLPRFDPRHYTNKSMLEEYVSEYYPGSISITSLYDIPLVNNYQNIGCSSLSSFFVGKSTVPLLKALYSNMTYFSKNLPNLSCFGDEFSPDAIKDCLNQYKLKIDEVSNPYY